MNYQPILNPMEFGNQSGNRNIQPMVPNVAYDLPQRLFNQTQEVKGDTMPIAGKYLAYV
jgi:hypothetical protein